MSEYQHRPDQGPGGGSERQFLLYMVIAFLLVWTFSSIFLKPQQGQQKQSEQQNQPAKPATQPAQNSGTKATASPAQTAAPTLTKQASAEQTIVIENDFYKLTFTNRGAQVTSWVLKKYKDNAGKPLDLVNQQTAATNGLPLSLWTYDENLRKTLNEALYVAQPATAALQAPAALSFEYSADGVVARKTFSFDHSYVVKVQTSVIENGAPVQAFPAWPAAFGDQSDPMGYAYSRLDWGASGGVTHAMPFEHSTFSSNKWIADGNTVRDSFDWAGASDQFFAAVFMPAEPHETAIVTLNKQIELPRKPGEASDSKPVKVQALGIAAGNVNGETSTRLFVGPKDIDVLRSVHAGNGSDVTGVIDFGRFGFFARWLFVWLNWMHDHGLGNWGWAIVVMTIIINVIFLPMRLSQMKTSLKMQKVQPRVQDVNKKYEKYGLRDTAKQQQKQAEVMAIYKEEGINPVAPAGCLFTLVQLPLIYGFYAMLRNTIELRQANWLWIRDLSGPDPWHILPILTLVTMYAVQHMTPMPGMDPKQRRTMNIMMMAMFGWFTWAYSAGLALYLTMSYIISVIQQYFLNKSELGQEIRRVQEKRARKKK